MNPNVQRFLPPAVVIGTALFFGWPPAEPLDLGDDVVRVISVRWRPDELQDPAPVQTLKDPFVEVLVKSESAESQEAVVQSAPTGPDPGKLQSALTLHGIADTGGRRWAVLNGRPRLPGESFYAGDDNALFCELVSVQADHAVVRCEQTTVKVVALPAGTPQSKNSKSAQSATAKTVGQSPAATAADPIPPPPGLTDDQAGDLIQN